jgi:ribosomal subunit interface protein
MQMEFTLKNTQNKGQELKAFLEDKTSRLERYFQGQIHARWKISYENEEHVSHLHVTGNSIDYFGESRQHNLLSSIEEAVDKVERQLLRRKEIVKDHHQK